MTGQARGNLLTNEFLLLQTTSTEAFKGLQQGKTSPFFPKSTTQGLISMITKLLPQLPLTVPEAASAHLPQDKAV